MPQNDKILSKSFLKKNIQGQRILSLSHFNVLRIKKRLFVHKIFIEKMDRNWRYFYNRFQQVQPCYRGITQFFFQFSHVAPCVAISHKTMQQNLATIQIEELTIQKSCYMLLDNWYNLLSRQISKEKPRNLPQILQKSW